MFGTIKGIEARWGSLTLTCKSSRKETCASGARVLLLMLVVPQTCCETLYRTAGSQRYRIPRLCRTQGARERDETPHGSYLDEACRKLRHNSFTVNKRILSKGRSLMKATLQHIRHVSHQFYGVFSHILHLSRSCYASFIQHLSGAEHVLPPCYLETLMTSIAVGDLLGS
ncbi:hypothetical protein BDY19DRAFT_439067 [Irpex rosettiformis]|uniref:Uncharacterized protein n=1 Tax=Irpex rosettiformis TaxID=378272 RepID=A0ACB8TUH9_9APHY|nr:hypothetical protein BDY19DRAFT_439067 [Irpex rosettiformis]